MATPHDLSATHWPLYKSSDLRYLVRQHLPVSYHIQEVDAALRAFPVHAHSRSTKKLRAYLPVSMRKDMQLFLSKHEWLHQLLAIVQERKVNGSGNKQGFQVARDSITRNFIFSVNVLEDIFGWVERNFYRGKSAEAVRPEAPFGDIHCTALRQWVQREYELGTHDVASTNDWKFDPARASEISALGKPFSPLFS